MSAALDHVADLLEAAARELRELSGSSGGQLASLGDGEAECDVPGPEPEVAMTPPITTEPPMLMTRDEVAALLRIHPRTFGRLRADPEVEFPEPVQLGSALRWRRTSVLRWLAERTG